MKGGRLIPENLRSWLRHLRVLYMFLSREIDIKNIPKRIYVRFCIRFVILKKSYSTNMQPIWKRRYSRGVWETLVCSYYYLNATNTSNNGSAVLLSHASITWPVYCTVIGGSSCYVILTYTLHIYVWYNFDTVLCQFLETGTSDRCLISIVQLLRFLGFSLYPLSFFLYMHV